MSKFHVEAAEWSAMYELLEAVQSPLYASHVLCELLSIELRWLNKLGYRMLEETESNVAFLL